MADGLHPDVSIIGRHVRDTAAGTVTFSWPLTTIVFAVEGPCERLSIRMDGGNNAFNLRVDGRPTHVLMLAAGMATHTLAEDLPVGTTSVSLVKRTEADAGLGMAAATTTPVTLEAVVLSGGSLVAPAPPCRLIEFFGDSDTTAFGNEDRRTSFEEYTHDPAKQNVEAGYASLTAQAFGAAAHVIAYSGIGAVHNVEGPWIEALGGATGRQLYARRLALDTDSAASGAALGTPNLKVVKLGGNDYFELRPKIDDAAFVDAFVQGFVRTMVLIP